MKISFSGGNDPYTFSYSHDGIVQNSITTSLNPYIISTKNEGVYELVSFSDVNELGSVSGSAIVTIIESPEALFTLVSDTLSVINSTHLFQIIQIQAVLQLTLGYGILVIILLVR